MFSSPIWTRLFLPPIVPINSLTRADGGGQLAYPCARAPTVSATIRRFFCASLRRNEPISSHRPVISRYNGLLYPGGIINSVEVLFAEIRGYGDYGVAATELWS